MQDTLTAPPRHASEPATSTAPRLDLYAPIHKALRAFLSDTLLRVGRLDPLDDEDCAATLGQFDTLLELCASHIEHENAFLHPALEAAQAGAARRIGGEHVEHLLALADLGEASQRLRAASAEARPAAALALYRELALFVAENLQHMQIEETVHNAILWACYSDAELLALHDRLLATIGDAEMALVLRWMLPALNPADRAGMLAGMQAQMPPEAFRGVLDLAQSRLDARAWTKLTVALGLPQAAGLVHLA